MRFIVAFLRGAWMRGPLVGGSHSPFESTPNAANDRMSGAEDVPEDSWLERHQKGSKMNSYQTMTHRGIH